MGQGYGNSNHNSKPQQQPPAEEDPSCLGRVVDGVAEGEEGVGRQAHTRELGQERVLLLRSEGLRLGLEVGLPCQPLRRRDVTLDVPAMTSLLLFAVLVRVALGLIRGGDRRSLWSHFPAGDFFVFPALLHSLVALNVAAKNATPDQAALRNS